MDVEMDYQPGDIIVPMSPPFVKFLDASQKGHLCDNCLKAGDVHRCKGCQAMYYCGKNCQEQDWKDGHLIKCKSKVFTLFSKSCNESKGEEPTICYMATDGEERFPHERKSYLQRQYDFICACKLCTEEVSGLLVDYNLLQDYENQLKKFNSLSYRQAAVIRDKGLVLLRKLYYEYDERVTMFLYKYIMVLCMHNRKFGKVPVPVGILKEAAVDLDSRLRILPGMDSSFYSFFQMCLIKLGMKL